MKKKFFTAPLEGLAILLAITASLAPGQGAEKPTIVVARTEASQIAGWQPALGEGLAQMIVTELHKLGTFEVLESLALPDLESEQNLGREGQVSETERVETGAWEGADYILITKVTAFGSTETGFGIDPNLPVAPDPWARRLGPPGPGPRPGPGARPGPTPRPGPSRPAPGRPPPRGDWGFPGAPAPGIPIPFGGYSQKKSENKITIAWRIVDIATRKIKAADTAEGIEKGVSVAVGGFNFGQSQSRDSALGKATQRAVAKIIAQLRNVDLPPGDRVNRQQLKADAEYWKLRSVRGTVEAVAGKSIWISLGSAQGFVKGDRVKIYRLKRITNADGKLVATEFEECAVVPLTVVQRDKSKAEYTGAVPIEEGWAVADERLNIDDLQ